MPSSGQTFDVVIVGAGIVGCSAAYYLAKQGVSVCVCDRAWPGNEQSSRAWGFVRQQGRHPAELPLAQDALKIWRELTEEFGPAATNYVQAGVLMPAETEQDEALIGRAYEAARAQGLPTEILSSLDLSARIPELRGKWRSALYTEGDGHADPALGTATIQSAAEDAGAVFKLRSAVTGFLFEGAKIVGVRTESATIDAGTTIVTAGIGSRRLLKLLGYSAPVQVARSTVVRTSHAPHFTDIAMWSPRVAFRPCMDGSFVLGNGYRGAGIDYDITFESLTNLTYFLPALRKNARQLRLTLGSDLFRSLADTVNGARKFRSLAEPAVNASKAAFNLSQIKALFPHLDDLEIEQSWAGRLDLTPDLIPVIDRLESHPEVFMAFGFSGHGFAIGPSVGRELSRWIIDGEPLIDFSKFRHTRFSENDYEHVKAF